MSDGPKGESRYAPGNTGADGGYLVGKGKPPEKGKFRKGDGRARGKRTKGTSNLFTEFLEEMSSLVTVNVNGDQKRVTRQRAIMMKAAHDASLGDARARQTLLQLEQRFRQNREVNAAADAEETANQLTHISDLTEEELDALGRLLSKASGVPYVPPEATNPFARYTDPSDERNYRSEMTVDGLTYRRCSIEGIADELVVIDNRAYVSAALTLPEGCYPGHLERLAETGS